MIVVGSCYFLLPLLTPYDQNSFPLSKFDTSSESVTISPIAFNRQLRDPTLYFVIVLYLTTHVLQIPILVALMWNKVYVYG